MKRWKILGSLCLSVALAGTLLTAAAPVVRAGAERCPSVSSTPGIDYWFADYQQRGVTLCRGVDYTGYVKAYVQIVDFAEGARMRVMSEVAAGQAQGTPDTTFNKRTAEEWYDWVWGHVANPDPGFIFSVTNAGFFIDTDNGVATTPMSMPEKKWATVLSQGYALGHHGDAAWPAEKRKFGMTDPRTIPQSAYAGDFPSAAPDNTTYTAADVNSATRGLGNYFDGIVALHPYYGSSSDFRTYVGTKGSTWGGPQDHVYILTTAVMYTQHEARDILVNDFHTMWNIQLDGGGSTQFYSYDGRIDSPLCGVPFLGGCRRVPEVLLVYVSPWA